MPKHTGDSEAQLLIQQAMARIKGEELEKKGKGIAFVERTQAIQQLSTLAQTPETQAEVQGPGARPDITSIQPSFPRGGEAQPLSAGRPITDVRPSPPEDPRFSPPEQDPKRPFFPPGDLGGLPGSLSRPFTEGLAQGKDLDPSKAPSIFEDLVLSSIQILNPDNAVKLAGGILKAGEILAHELVPEAAKVLNDPGFADPSIGSGSSQILKDIPRTLLGLAGGLVGYPQFIVDELTTPGRQPLDAVSNILMIPGSIEAMGKILSDPTIRTVLASALSGEPGAAIRIATLIDTAPGDSPIRTPFGSAMAILAPVLLSKGGKSLLEGRAPELFRLVEGEGVVPVKSFLKLSFEGEPAFIEKSGKIVPQSKASGSAKYVTDEGQIRALRLTDEFLAAEKGLQAEALDATVASVMGDLIENRGLLTRSGEPTAPRGADFLDNLTPEVRAEFGTILVRAREAIKKGREKKAKETGEELDPSKTLLVDEMAAEAMAREELTARLNRRRERDQVPDKYVEAAERRRARREESRVRRQEEIETETGVEPSPREALLDRLNEIESRPPSRKNTQEYNEVVSELNMLDKEREIKAQNKREAFLKEIDEPTEFEAAVQKRNAGQKADARVFLDLERRGEKVDRTGLEPGTRREMERLEAEGADVSGAADFLLKAKAERSADAGVATKWIEENGQISFEITDNPNRKGGAYLRVISPEEGKPGHWRVTRYPIESSKRSWNQGLTADSSGHKVFSSYEKAVIDTLRETGKTNLSTAKNSLGKGRDPELTRLLAERDARYEKSFDLEDRRDEINSRPLTKESKKERADIISELKELDKEGTKADPEIKRLRKEESKRLKSLDVSFSKNDLQDAVLFIEESESSVKRGGPAYDSALLSKPVFQPWGERLRAAVEAIQKGEVEAPSKLKGEALERQLQDRYIDISKEFQEFAVKKPIDDFLETSEPLSEFERARAKKVEEQRSVREEAAQWLDLEREGYSIDRAEIESVTVKAMEKLEKEGVDVSGKGDKIRDLFEERAAEEVDAFFTIKLSVFLKTSLEVSKELLLDENPSRTLEILKREFPDKTSFDNARAILGKMFDGSMQDFFNMYGELETPGRTVNRILGNLEPNAYIRLTIKSMKKAIAERKDDLPFKKKTLADINVVEKEVNALQKATEAWESSDGNSKHLALKAAQIKDVIADMADFLKRADPVTSKKKTAPLGEQLEAGRKPVPDNIFPFSKEIAETLKKPLEELKKEVSAASDGIKRKREHVESDAKFFLDLERKGTKIDRGAIDSATLKEMERLKAEGVPEKGLTPSEPPSLAERIAEELNIGPEDAKALSTEKSQTKRLKILQKWYPLKEEFQSKVKDLNRLLSKAASVTSENVRAPRTRGIDRLLLKEDAKAAFVRRIQQDLPGISKEEALEILNGARQDRIDQIITDSVDTVAYDEFLRTQSSADKITRPRKGLTSAGEKKKTLTQKQSLEAYLEFFGHRVAHTLDFEIPEFLKDPRPENLPGNKPPSTIPFSMEGLLETSTSIPEQPSTPPKPTVLSGILTLPPEGMAAQSPPTLRLTGPKGTAEVVIENPRVLEALRANRFSDGSSISVPKSALSKEGLIEIGLEPPGPSASQVVQSLLAKNVRGNRSMQTVALNLESRALSLGGKDVDLLLGRLSKETGIPVKDLISALGEYSSGQATRYGLRRFSGPDAEALTERTQAMISQPLSIGLEIEGGQLTIDPPRVRVASPEAVSQLMNAYGLLEGEARVILEASDRVAYPVAKAILATRGEAGIPLPVKGTRVNAFINVPKLARKKKGDSFRRTNLLAEPVAKVISGEVVSATPEVTTLITARGKEVKVPTRTVRALAVDGAVNNGAQVLINAVKDINAVITTANIKEATIRMKLPSEVAARLLSAPDPVGLATQLKVPDPQMAGAIALEIRRKSFLSAEDMKLPTTDPSGMKMGDSALTAAQLGGGRTPSNPKEIAEAQKKLKKESDLASQPPGKTPTPMNKGISYDLGRQFSVSDWFSTPTNQWWKIDRQAGILADKWALGDIKIGRLRNAAMTKLRNTLNALPRTTGERLLRREPTLGRGKSKKPLKFGEEMIADVLDGQTREQISARTDLNPVVKEVALEIRSILDQFRDEIIDEMVRSNRLDPAAIPEEWGLEGYWPHMYEGEYLIATKTKEFINGKQQWQFIGSGKTRKGAIKNLIEDMKAYDRKPSDYKIIEENILSPDSTKFGEKRAQNFIEKNALELSEIIDGNLTMKKDVFEGLINKALAKSNKQKTNKHSQFLSKRKGTARGYSKDVLTVMDAYTASVTRWIEINKLARESSEFFEKLLKNRRPGLARHMEAKFDLLWGQRTSFSRDMDIWFQSHPVLRDSIWRTRGVDRISAALKNTTSSLLLKTPRFAFLNSMQPFQTLWPTVSTFEFAKGIRSYYSKEGTAILEKHGVNYDTSRWETSNKAFGKFRGRVTERNEFLAWRNLNPFGQAKIAEIRNQGISFLTYYHKAKALGLNNNAAARVATLRGQVYTQFLGAITDTPIFAGKLLAHGPVTSAITQFRRFQLKNLEIGFDLLRQADPLKDVPTFSFQPEEFGGPRKFKTQTGRLGFKKAGPNPEFVGQDLAPGIRQHPPMFKSARMGGVAGGLKWIGSNVMIGGLRTYLRYALPISLVAKYPLNFAGKVIGKDHLGTDLVSSLLPMNVWLALRDFGNKYDNILPGTGEQFANAVLYGLPGLLLGVDMSYSTQLLDVPMGKNVTEQVAQLFAPPFAQLGMRIGGAALSDEGPKFAADVNPADFIRGGDLIPDNFTPDEVGRTMAAALRKAPALRLYDGLSRISTRLLSKTKFDREHLKWAIQNPGALTKEAFDLLSKESYDFTTPGGRLEFRTDLGGVLKQAMGFSSIENAMVNDILDTLVPIFEDRDKAINEAAKQYDRFSNSLSKEDDEKVDQIVNLWNELWGGEFGFNKTDVSQRWVAHIENADLDKRERMISNMPKVFNAMGIEVGPELFDYMRQVLIGEPLDLISDRSSPRTLPSRNTTPPKNDEGVPGIFKDSSIESDQTYIKGILNKHKDLDFVKRILNTEGAPEITLPGGKKASHLMAMGESDGFFFVYPTLVNRGGRLVEPAAPAREALKTGEFIKFTNEEEALWFSRNYKRIWEKEK